MDSKQWPDRPVPLQGSEDTVGRPVWKWGGRLVCVIIVQQEINEGDKRVVVVKC